MIVQKIEFSDYDHTGVDITTLDEGVIHTTWPCEGRYAAHVGRWVQQGGIIGEYKSENWVGIVAELLGNTVWLKFRDNNIDLNGGLYCVLTRDFAGFREWLISTDQEYGVLTAQEKTWFNDVMVHNGFTKIFS